jgi:hypothetical protein
VFARGQLKVVGTTDTAVGEVGVVVQLRVNSHALGDKGVISNEHWGWWKMTPELTLGGGYTGSLANIGYGYDGACNCYYTDNAPVALNPGDTTQMRLSYASGPISFAIALEDHDQVVSNRDATATLDDSLGVAGEIKYAGDTFSGEISGGYWGKGGDATSAQIGVFLPGGATTAAGIVGAPTASSAWQLGVGLGFSFDSITLSLAAGAGQDHIEQDYWKASILASANLSDSVHAEIAYGYRASDSYICTGTGAAAGSFCGETDARTHAVLAGIYYDPVSQLTIGLEGEWFQTKFDGNTGDDLFGTDNQYNAKSTTWQVDLVTVFRF